MLKKISIVMYSVCKLKCLPEYVQWEQCTVRKKCYQNLSNSNQKSTLLAQDTHIDKWHRIESPEIYVCKYSQLIFNKCAKTIQWGKEKSFQ